MIKWWRTRQLHSAARDNDVQRIVHLIGRGTEPDSRREYGISDRLTALHIASLHRSLDAVGALLDTGADISATCHHFSEFDVHATTDEKDDGWTALHLATEAGDAEVIDTLCTREACIDARTRLGRTALHVWARYAQQSDYVSDHTAFLRVLQVLLSRGVDVNARDHLGRTALFEASETNGNAEAVELLLNAGADVNACDDSGQNALFWADGYGVVELLLRRGANHRVVDKRGWTALKTASITFIHEHKVELLEGLR